MHPFRILPLGRSVYSLGRAPRGAVKLRMVITLLILGGFVAAAVYATMRVDTEEVPALVKKMNEAFAEGETLQSTEPKKALQKYLETERYADRVLAKEPLSTQGLLFKGQSLVRLGRDKDALGYFLQARDSESDSAAWCHLQAGQILCNQDSKYTEGEAQFRRALELQPGEPNATWLLANVLRLGTRNWELIPFELGEIEQKQRLHIQVMDDLTRNQHLPPDVDLVLKGMKANPTDPNVLLGHANLLRAEQKYDQAEADLRKVIELAPQIDEAQVRLGWVLFESGNDAKFLQWQTNVKPPILEHPLYWLVCAARAERAHEPEVAARCNWEALKRDPNLPEANYQLGLLLTSMDRKTEAVPFLDRAKKLTDYVELARLNHFRAFELGKGDIELASRAIKSADELGNLWEAYGWTLMTLQIDPSNKALEQDIKQIEPQLKDVEKRRTLPNYNPALKIDLAKMPLPKWSEKSAIASPKVPASQVSFEDQASAAGIHFEYFDGQDPKVNGLNKFNAINGGGAGVVDFDRDGWPDLYFTQGSKDPQDRDQTDHLDRLYRNLGDGHFADATAQAHIVENAFSQGVTVGDIDNDGFPDIFVANIGSNRLFVNNGDGTFSDASEDSGANESQWTSSCVIADFNGDSLPDIYALGYLEGDALTRICNDTENHHYPCQTYGVPSAHHRLWLNTGDGRFEDATASAQIDHFSNRGTSVIAADLDGSRKLNLLVGNSGTQNFFFRNDVAKAGDPLKFTEAALSMGLAFGADGIPRRCIGLAAGDFNGDGLLDFHGTSVAEESDTLYLQQNKNALFFDKATAAGLFSTTFMECSWGTQAIDGALDGKLDLIASCGSPDNPRNQFIPYEMRPSYLTNDGQGHFAPVPAETLGPYFQQKHLGRAVAKLDWNRDGLEDVVVCHSRAPAALLTNTTRKPGHHLTIRLVSTASARDAIGTTVEVVAGGKKIVRQLSAGDGFQASNDRALVFGLGSNAAVESVVIHWMSGRDQRLAGMPADKELLIVEGRDQPTTLTRD
ncbi:MAG TPA: FG-GAP-like repeat-containing protein [Planctomycetaceae bacterium]|nr:FG-GAP-like repeat-containing protein [Planctomycetaceae bacterium]